MLTQAIGTRRANSIGAIHGYASWFSARAKGSASSQRHTSTQGSPILKDVIPAADSYGWSVAQAGVIFLGKTTRLNSGLDSQTYNPVLRKTRNAYDQSGRLAAAAGWGRGSR